MAEVEGPLVDIPHLVREYLEIYGYWILFIGTFLEGEAILLLAGLLAFQGHLAIIGVIVVSWFGSFCGDQFFFYLGRHKGRWLLHRFRSIARKFRTALRLIETYGNFVAFISRFTYGFRIILPIILGVTDIAPGIFLRINLISALVWAVTFSLGGYLFGKSASVLLDDVGTYEQYLVLALLGMISLAWCGHAYQVWRLRKPARDRLARFRALRAEQRISM